MTFLASVALILVAHLAFVAAFLVMAALSKVFGIAKKQKPLYKLFHAAAALAAVAMVLSLAGLQTGFLAYAAAGLDLAAMFMACGTAYFYWEWLPRELAREVAHGENTGG